MPANLAISPLSFDEESLALLSLESSSSLLTFFALVPDACDVAGVEVEFTVTAGLLLSDAPLSAMTREPTTIKSMPAAIMRRHQPAQSPRVTCAIPERGSGGGSSATSRKNHSSSVANRAEASKRR